MPPWISPASIGASMHDAGGSRFYQGDAGNASCPRVPLSVIIGVPADNGVINK
jgi:hypothetical protein